LALFFFFFFFSCIHPHPLETVLSLRSAVPRSKYVAWDRRLVRPGDWYCVDGTRARARSRAMATRATVLILGQGFTSLVPVIRAQIDTTNDTIPKLQRYTIPAVRSAKPFEPGSHLDRTWGFGSGFGEGGGGGFQVSGVSEPNPR
ncbi:hypothetical protein BJV74DRAFT_864181, partial [Russula compacta]